MCCGSPERVSEAVPMKLFVSSQPGLTILFTATLQVPYLLNVALAITEYLPAFPPSPRPTFALLKKLDHCFSSLLRGRDIRSGATLPGFEHGMSKGMTRTDMVRIRSLADETRSQVAMKMSGEAEVDTSIFPEDSEVSGPASSGAKRKLPEEDEYNAEVANSPPSISSPKRRETESPVSVKVESPTFNQVSDRRSPNYSIGTNNDNATTSGQFHWAVEEDSDDEQDEPGNSEEPMGDADEMRPQQVTPPASVPGHDLYTHHMDSRSRFADEDDEVQELHMSVAKVYERTIVQLGRTLGETLVDE